MIKTILISLFAITARCADVVLGTLSSLTWQASGNDYVAVWDTAVPGLAPLAWYKMDDNTASTTVIDSSGNEYIGTATSNTDTKTATGIDGGALTFDGTSDWITIGDGMFNSSSISSLSLSGWIFRGEGGAFQMLITKHGTTGTDFAFDLQSIGSLRFYVNGGSDGLMYSAIELNSGWSHVCLTFQDGEVKLYVNGEEVAIVIPDSAFTSSIALSSVPVVIGAYANESDRYPFCGLLDDVRIYTDCLSSNQVYTLFTSYGYTPPPPPETVTITFDATSYFPGDHSNVYLDYGSAEYTPGQPFGAFPYAYDTSYTYSFSVWRDDRYNYYYDPYTDLAPASSTTLYAEWY